MKEHFISMVPVISSKSYTVGPLYFFFASLNCSEFFGGQNHGTSDTIYLHYAEQSNFQQH